MAVPRNRHSNARKRNRRSHHAKSKVHLVNCSNCARRKLPHHLCPHCGNYHARQFAEVE